MVNALQIIANIPLISVNFPANASYFFSLILKIANFNIIPMEKIIDEIFNFSNKDTSFSKEFNALDIFYYSI